MFVKFAKWLKDKLGGVTEIGHAIFALILMCVGLLVVSIFDKALAGQVAPLASVIICLFAAFTVGWYSGQEVRDATNKYLKENRGTYWTAWAYAILPAIRSKDYIYPLIVVFAVLAIYTFGLI